MQKAQHAVRRGKGTKRALVAVVVITLLAALSIPFTAFGALPTPDYTWYSGHESEDSYTITNERQFLGFIYLVNGTADVNADGTDDAAVSFAGKTVTLFKNLSYTSVAGDELIPVGSAEHPFAGVFDGQGYTINNFNVKTTDVNENVGLFGYVATQEGSASAGIKNLNIGSGATLSIERTAKTAADGAVPLNNIGSLVGYCNGFISNCSSAGTLTISNAMDQTTAVPFTVKNVGGLAGQCTGNITGCTNNATLNVSATGDYNKEGELYTIVLNVGGIVGCAGDEDSSVAAYDGTTAGSDYGTVSGCSNSGSITVTVSDKTYTDRFGNNDVTMQIAAIGGIAGYSRGSIIGCSNAGVFDAQRSRDMGGIVGALRTGIDSTNFSEEGSDDGMKADAIVVQDCRNTGSLVGYAFVGGIAGRAGTNTTIEGCLNGVDANGKVCDGTSKVYILATRSTKPFPAGIAGATYGVVSYCGNFAEVGSAIASSINISDLSTYTGGAGYYASGIVGIVEYYTDADGTIIQDMPEVYGCLNVGAVKSQNDQFRNRAIVGDNEGYVHDNLALTGTAPELYFTESSLGTIARTYFVSGTDLKANATVEDTETTAIEVLNAQADADNWTYYWTTSDGTANDGYAVLNTQVSWDATDLSAATVAWKADAEYNGAEAVPQATVTLNQGTDQEKVLTQNVDFRVVPQSGAKEVSYSTEAKDYIATIQGIGSYTGTATQTLAYDIQRGNLANTTVTIASQKFNWEAQTPTDVKVINSANLAVDPNEYSYELDSTDTDLTDGQAINAKEYTVNIKANDSSTHYYGSTTGTFNIAKVKIVWDGADTTNAQVHTISYLGTSYDWQSTSDSSATGLELEYTGHSIQPEVTKVTYLGKELTAGVDYKVYYGNGYQMDGDTPDTTPNTEVGDIACIMVRGLAGGNFTNYDIMNFTIVEAASTLDISKGSVPAIADIVYEAGDPYTPVTVMYGGSLLTEGTDYTVEYTGNDKVGTASYVVTGKGAYTGTLSGTFNIVEGTPYEFTYELDKSAQTATITGVIYKGVRDTFDMVIPATIEEDGASYTVTAIASYAFGGKENSQFTGSDANLSKRKIASVTIPASVKIIGEYAFGSGTTLSYKMDQLTAVTFAEGSQLETVSKFAFATTGVTEITIPESVTSLGNGAFAASALQKITFNSTTAGQPTVNYSTGNTNTFYQINNVQAYAYDGVSDSLKSAIQNSTWTWNSLGPVPTTVLYGDANSDGNVTSRDATVVQFYVAGKTTSINQQAADVNGDGVLTSRDATYIQFYVAGKISKFPVEQ